MCNFGWRQHHEAPEEAEEPPAAAVAAAGFFVKKPMSDGWALRAVSTLLRLLPAALATAGALALVLAAGAFVAGVVAAAEMVFSAADSGLLWVPPPGCKLSAEGASAERFAGGWPDEFPGAACLPPTAWLPAAPGVVTGAAGEPRAGGTPSVGSGSRA